MTVSAWLVLAFSVCFLGGGLTWSLKKSNKSN